MKVYGLITLFAIIALLTICSGQRPPNCADNVAILCGSGTPVKAKEGQGECREYESRCLVEQLNCIRYNNGEMLLKEC